MQGPEGASALSKAREKVLWAFRWPGKGGCMGREGRRGGRDQSWEE